MGESDKTWVLELARQVAEAGDNCLWDANMSDEDISTLWQPDAGHRSEVHICEVEGVDGIAGAFALRPCAPGRGSHVAQCTCMVAPSAKNLRVLVSLIEHAVVQAQFAGYLAMQPNTVVAYDDAVIEAWTTCGFEVKCMLPRAFWHPAKEFLDTYIMFRSLEDTNIRSVPSTPVEVPMRIDEDFASRLEAVAKVEDILPEPSRNIAFGDWMIWMVHRAWLNDPSLIDFDFGGMHMPPPHLELRIAPKLMEALRTNTHIEVLYLANSNLQRAQGSELAQALLTNTTLRFINVESNSLDSTAVREIAQAIRQNRDSRIEDLRLAHQKKGGKYFGRPTEEAVGFMMEKNETITRLGFECNDAHWRNIIDRGLLRNGDLQRRRQQGSDDCALPPLECTRTLGQLMLRGNPDVPAWSAEQDCARVVRGYVLQNMKLPTTPQLQSYAKSTGTATVSYSTAAPLLKECRCRMLDAAVCVEVVVTDVFGKESLGTLRSWSEVNDRWTLDIWAEDGKRYAFRSDKEPSISVSELWAHWFQ